MHGRHFPARETFNRFPGIFQSIFDAALEHYWFSAVVQPAFHSVVKRRKLKRRDTPDFNISRPFFSQSNVDADSVYVGTWWRITLGAIPSLPIPSLPSPSLPFLLSPTSRKAPNRHSHRTRTSSPSPLGRHSNRLC